MIDGVKVTQLRQILDERKGNTCLGVIQKYLKGFEIIHVFILAQLRPGISQGDDSLRSPWEHQIVLYDDRPESPTCGEVQEIFLGPDNYCLVTVPPMVWNGFKGLGGETAIVANCDSIPHDPTEIDRKAAFDPSIPYDWQIKHR